MNEEQIISNLHQKFVEESAARIKHIQRVKNAIEFDRNRGTVNGCSVRLVRHSFIYPAAELTYLPMCSADDIGNGAGSELTIKF